jgi:nucleoside 2-deoxyribosyltransferase
MMGIWEDDIAVDGASDGQMFQMRSGRNYLFSRSLLASKPDAPTIGRAQLTRYIDEHPEDNVVIFNTTNYPEILARRKLPYSRRSSLLLQHLLNFLDGRPGTISLTYDPPSNETLDAQRAAYAEDAQDLADLLEYLSESDAIGFQLSSSSFGIDLPVRTVARLEETEQSIDSKSVFVAMWFNDEMRLAYDLALVPAIESLGYNAVRVDAIAHNEKIDDRIISEIRSAKFVVADFSCGPDGARGGVYFEAGFALGLGIPVIFSVRASDINRVHFDTRQYNHLVWTSEDDLRQKLRDRISATIL